MRDTREQDERGHNTSHISQNRDNIDCRHIDHLAIHKVQTVQLAKNMKTQFWLRNEQHWLQSNMTAVCPFALACLKSSQLDIRSSAQNIHCVNSICDHRKKTRTMKHCRPRVVSNVS